MAYEYPSTSATSSMTGFFQYLNSVTNGYFFTMIVIGIFAVTLMGYYHAKRNWNEAFAVAGFITTIVSVFFTMIGLLPISHFVVIVGIAIVSGAILFMKSDR